MLVSKMTHTSYFVNMVNRIYFCSRVRVLLTTSFLVFLFLPVDDCFELCHSGKLHPLFFRYLHFLLGQRVAGDASLGSYRLEFTKVCNDNIVFRGEVLINDSENNVAF